jgi:hypothetical protein
MTSTILVTVSDDRFGRKNSKYSITQDKIAHIIGSNPQFGVDKLHMWKWEAIEKTDFYKQNKTLLDNTDASRNGRAYKPYVILKALEEVSFGDYVIYTDCSPEMWNMPYDFQLPLNKFSLDVIHNLCKSNRNILTCFVKWSNKPLEEGELGSHIHKYFTLNRCMDKMGLRKFEDCYMHASGMWCIRKTEDTLSLVKEWLKWNCDEDCCSMGRIAIPDDYSFWNAESQLGKMGHRHDQSISGLLVNNAGHKLIDILYNNMNPYNFLQYTRTDEVYSFIDPHNVKVEQNNKETNTSDISINDIVINERGTELKVFRIEKGEDGENLYIVGKSDASLYATTKEYLKLKKNG